MALVNTYIIIVSSQRIQSNIVVYVSEYESTFFLVIKESQVRYLYAHDLKFDW